MKVRQLVYSLMGALCVGAQASAAVIIPTNFMGGADTDLREHEINASALQPNVVTTSQRGASPELATSGIDAPDFDNMGVPTMTNGDRNNIFMMKFNISQLPNHNSNPGYWADKEIAFRTTLRQTNLTNARVQTPANGQSFATRYVNFNVLGLEPSPFKNGVDASGGYRYADDDASAATRTDRSGNTYTANQYKYNWAEGTGIGTSTDSTILNSGVSFVNAPGITPFCMRRGSCDITTYANNVATEATNIYQSLGKFDDFNSDTRLLGSYKWNVGANQYPGAARQPIGHAMDYVDTNGALEQLIFDAQDNNRDFVTLYLQLAVDVRNAANGGTNPNDWLNFSYTVNPKEVVTLANDNSFDPDGAGPLPVLGSPYSCDGSTLTSVCNGDGTPPEDTVLRTLGNNSAGVFSPQLIIRTPEPTSGLLMMIGAVVAGMIRRRK